MLIELITTENKRAYVNPDNICTTTREDVTGDVTMNFNNGTSVKVPNYMFLYMIEAPYSNLSVINVDTKQLELCKAAVVNSPFKDTRVPLEIMNLSKGSQYSVGDVIKLEANKSGDVAWVSANPNVLTVTNGTVTLVSPGMAMITATMGNETATTVLRCYPRNIVLNPIVINLKPNETYPISDGLVYNGNPATVTWEFSDSSVARVDEVEGKYVLVGVGSGSTTLKAKIGEETSTHITVEVEASSVKILTPNESTMYRPETMEIVTETVNFDNNLVSLESSNTSILEVTGKTVKAVGSGRATITAHCPGGTDSIDIFVYDVSLDLNPKTQTLAPGEEVQMDAIVVGTSEPTSYSSSNEAIARVSSLGLVTAVADGSATITATVLDVSGTSTITVVTPTPPAPEPGPVEVEPVTEETPKENK